MLRPADNEAGLGSLRILVFLRNGIVPVLNSPIRILDQAASASCCASKNARTASS
jgi:hypothetical protein